MRHFVAYIDEAGDEGFGKLAAGPVGGQSRWLILGACIVSRETDLTLPSLRDKIISRFPAHRRRDLHFRDLKHDQKVVVAQEMAEMPLGACLTFSHKVTIPGSRFEDTFKKKGFLYNYLVRWLLERITRVIARKYRGEECHLRIVFSRRGGTDYNAMSDYMRLMRNGNEAHRPVRSIDWDLIDIDAIKVENHSKWAGLQFADCFTSAFFSAVEPNHYGNYEPTYARLLRKRLIRDHGLCLNCGVTPVPSLEKCAADAKQLAFFREF